jgi:exodeoxyribonuclease VIII
MGQSDKARAVFKDKGKPLAEVLNAFTKFIGIENVGQVKLWGNGANFDNVILVNAYRRTGIKAPWQFYNDRCYRTIKSMFKRIEMERSGTHHNALDDAKSQADHLVRILTTIGGRHS